MPYLAPITLYSPAYSLSRARTMLWTPGFLGKYKHPRRHSQRIRRLVHFVKHKHLPLAVILQGQCLWREYVRAHRSRRDARITCLHVYDARRGSFLSTYLHFRLALSLDNTRAYVVICIYNLLRLFSIMVLPLLVCWLLQVVFAELVT